MILRDCGDERGKDNTVTENLAQFSVSFSHDGVLTIYCIGAFLYEGKILLKSSVNRKI